MKVDVCSKQVARGTVRVNSPIPAKLPKKTQNATTKKLKKIRGSKLCSRHFNVNEQLNQKEAEEVPEIVQTAAIPPARSEPEEVPETVQTPAIPPARSEAEEVPEIVQTPAIPPARSEPEEVPETVETPPIPGGPVDSQ
ncbi:unnamed protein product [Rangifer tarandus platyrhynchus]|uniref:Uncharacterized protein n=1 Tax=Rangifer tarandus platyrhynchus TaxID=3082113 RepID=A0ABN9A1N3_RANTA|nr:unnamed protein product [Rangifer tarandus platyrhynchus]